MTFRPMTPDEAPPARLVWYVEEPTWALQPKIDGHHVVVQITQGRPTVWGKDGQPSQHNRALHSSRHLAEWARLPTYTVLDAELVDGVCWVFDLPEEGSVDLDTPFAQRCERLEALFGTWQPDPDLFRLVPTAFGHEDKGEMAIECLATEGVVARRLAGRYLAGRKSPDVVKIKFVNEADVVVTGLRHDDKDNAVLSVNNHGESIEVGRASTHGKGPIKEGDVVIVRYSRFTTGGRLREPRIIRRRSDKAPMDCTMDQLERR